MKVIICGAGQVGWQIARHLAGEKNDVTIVDSNQDLVTRATDTLDVKGVCGFASYPNVLSNAGAEDADMIIAATHSDEVNMVTCQVAHSIFDIPRKIARLRSQSYLDAIYADLYRRDHLPIDVVISPELEVAEAALKRLSAPNAFESESFLNDKAQLLGLHIGENCPVINTPLRQLTDLFSTLRVIVVGVRRQGILFAPNAGDQIFPSDEVYLICHSKDSERTMDVFGKSYGEQNRVIVIGGAKAGSSFIDKLKLIVRLVNIGDAKSLACHPASTTHRQLSKKELEAAGVPEDMVRLSIGIEHIDDIIEDLSQALSVKDLSKVIG